jgi:hypothetical protein
MDMPQLPKVVLKQPDLPDKLHYVVQTGPAVAATEADTAFRLRHGILLPPELQLGIWPS